MTDREKVDAKRNEIVQSILGYIEQHPTNWLSGWVSLGVPQNGLTNSNYRGLNALYLWLIGKQQGYTDNRWVTFNQAKELGASVKKGEKSSPILFYTLYDKNTKKEYTRKTTADMTDEERKKYEDENVRPVVRYSQVFNAQQCANFPERAATSLMSDEERQKHSNDVIERIIANSEAPILYDGGDRAFYRITTDDIHLPAIEQFNTMQDYYATALHEIAHSTGHPSRLNRKMGGADRENYAIEELRAEMAAVFMQMENGIQLEGKHYENHSAYLASWLEEVKNDTKIFTSAVSDAMKISDYVTEHYVNKAAVATLDEQSVTVAAEVKTQKKNPSAQTTTSSSSSQKWQRVTIPADCIGQEYGARTMVSVPKTSGYTGFAMFVPTKMLQKQEDGTYALLYDSTKKDFLKASNDGREVVFDGETLDKIMRGEKVPYQAKRVRAGKEAQKMIEQTLANIPSEMQEMERWCVHQKYFAKNAKGETEVKKRIFNVNLIEEKTDNYAKCNDSSTWASIDAATSAIKTSKKSLTGLTFVIGEGISVIDLDHCFDSAGHPSALAADLMSAFEGTTYMEKSMSGTGLHIFVKGDLRNADKFGKVNKGDFGDIEVYDESKFMSVTGNIIGDVRTLGNVTALQQAAVQKYLKANEMAQKKTTATQKRSAFSTGFVSDDDVIAKIRASKRGAEFDSLYAGHKEGKDWSREDYALINIVAFFTPNQDRNQIQRIFEHSGLYRPQKGEKYVDRTIDAVLSKLKNPTNIWNNQSTSGAAKPKTGDTK